GGGESGGDRGGGLNRGRERSRERSRGRRQSRGGRSRRGVLDFLARRRRGVSKRRLGRRAVNAIGPGRKGPGRFLIRIGDFGRRARRLGRGGTGRRRGRGGRGLGPAALRARQPSESPSGTRGAPPPRPPPPPPPP